MNFKSTDDFERHLGQQPLQSFVELDSFTPTTFIEARADGSGVLTRWLWAEDVREDSRPPEIGVLYDHTTLDFEDHIFYSPGESRLLKTLKSTIHFTYVIMEKHPDVWLRRLEPTIALVCIRRSVTDPAEARALITACLPSLPVLTKSADPQFLPDPVHGRIGSCHVCRPCEISLTAGPQGHGHVFACRLWRVYLKPALPEPDVTLLDELPTPVCLPPELTQAQRERKQKNKKRKAPLL